MILRFAVAGVVIALAIWLWEKHTGHSGISAYAHHLFAGFHR